MIEIFRTKYKRPSTLHVYVKAGQSNNLGARNPPYVPQETDKHIKLYPELGRQLKPDVYPPRDASGTQSPERLAHNLAPLPFAGGLRAGPEISFGRLLARRYGRRHNTVIAKFAIGGSSLERHWMTPTQGRLFDRLITFLSDLRTTIERNGDTFKVSGFTWLQGETDVKVKRDARLYAKNLQTLITAVRNLAGDDNLPVVIDRTYVVTTTANQAEALKMVRQAQENFVKADQYAALVDLDDLAHDKTGVHFLPEEFARIGEREFDALMSISGARLRDRLTSMFSRGR